MGVICAFAGNSLWRISTASARSRLYQRTSLEPIRQNCVSKPCPRRSRSAPDCVRDNPGPSRRKPAPEWGGAGWAGRNGPGNRNQSARPVRSPRHRRSAGLFASSHGPDATAATASFRARRSIQASAPSRSRYRRLGRDTNGSGNKCKCFSLTSYTFFDFVSPALGSWRVSPYVLKETASSRERT